MFTGEGLYLSRDKSQDEKGYVAHIMPDNRYEQTTVDQYYDDFYTALLPKDTLSSAYTKVSESLARYHFR